MPARVCLIQGHPEAEGHLCHALADAYARGAEAAGATVDRVSVAEIAPAPLASAAEFDTEPGGAMTVARESVRAATHLVIVFPLWLGTQPALLKAFFEQMARAGFALSAAESETAWPKQNLRGRSAHVIVTMGMPAIAYRVWFLNSGVAVLKRMVLGMAGVSPVRQTTIGGVGALSESAARRWLERIEAAGRALR